MPEILGPDGQKYDLDATLQSANERDLNERIEATDTNVNPLPKLTQDEKLRVKEAPKRRTRPGKNERARTAQAVRASSPAVDQERSDGIKGLVQMSAAVCLVADSRTPDHDISFQADAITLASAADQIADAVVATCKKSESFARVVDKVTQVGPYAALVGVVFSVGAQLARNHGMQAAEMMGAVPPEQLIASVMQDDPASI